MNLAEIREEAISYFSKVFHENSASRHVFHGLDFKRLSESQGSELIELFSHLEI